MRVRFRRSLLIKLGIICIAIFLLVPIILNISEDFNPKGKSSGSRQERKLAIDKKQFDEKHHENVAANPMNVAEMNQDEKTYGPEAILKPGILGNFEPKYPENKKGPGEGGVAVYPSMEEKSNSDQAIQEFGFNMVVSDKIAMNRTLPDTRLDECMYWHYPEQLPTASVILVFHNEGFSTLVRTIHSIINMSPPHLLKEVVLVDDFSTKEHLGKKFEEYIAQFNGKAKLYRNKERLGLIQTRTRGAELSVGDVIIFLDAHCECNRNWLTPLLARIAHDRTTMAVPMVDGIDFNNFQYRPVYDSTHHRGIFEWGFLYKESPVPQKELNKRKHHSAPYRSPTHAGGLFAMDRKYFFEMGAYDPGMQIWGGENFELSFKIWQCGGSIEWVPCSRVGHVYRNHMPYGFGDVKHKIPVVLLNYMRVVEVWLDDEFKEYFYTREPAIRGYPVGDISKQLQFKKDHNCKSFKWFMENIAYEIFDRFPPLPPNKAWGEFMLKGGSKCWDSLNQGVGGGPIGISSCHHFGGNQMYRLNTKGQIGVGERCIDAAGGNTLHIAFCQTQPTGPWDWDEKTGLMKHTDHNKCVGIEDDNHHIHLEECDAEKPTQLWVIKEIHTW